MTKCVDNARLRGDGVVGAVVYLLLNKKKTPAYKSRHCKAMTDAGVFLFIF